MGGLYPIEYPFRNLKTIIRALVLTTCVLTHSHCKSCSKRQFGIPPWFSNQIPPWVSNQILPWFSNQIPPWFSDQIPPWFFNQIPTSLAHLSEGL
jgi:hypothetical protein